MSEEGKIYIVVTDKLPNGSSSTPISTVKTVKKEKSEDEILMHYARSKIIGEVKTLSTQAVNYQLSNIGNFTGNYMLQNHVNSAVSALKEMGDIALTMISGMAIGGPLGAVIGGSLSIINKGISNIFSINSAMIANKKTNYEIEQLRIRSGLDPRYNDSRGTEN